MGVDSESVQVQNQDQESKPVVVVEKQDMAPSISEPAPSWFTPKRCNLYVI